MAIGLRDTQIDRQISIARERHVMIKHDPGAPIRFGQTIDAQLPCEAAAIEGDQTPVDWKESWSVTSVDDAAWKGLVSRVERDYQRLRRAFESKASSSDAAFGEAVGAIAHVAYHL